MLNLLGDFIGELRAAGIPVSMSEHVDAARAIEVINLGDRSMVRGSLAATLVKDGDHRLSRPEDIERLIRAVAEF